MGDQVTTAEVLAAASSGGLIEGIELRRGSTMTDTRLATVKRHYHKPLKSLLGIRRLTQAKVIRAYRSRQRRAHYRRYRAVAPVIPDKVLDIEDRILRWKMNVAPTEIYCIRRWKGKD